MTTNQAIALGLCIGVIVGMAFEYFAEWLDHRDRRKALEDAWGKDFVESMLELGKRFPKEKK